MNDSLDPVILVIFGITGDLAQRKVLPALYNLYANDQLNEQTYIVGTSRQAIDANEIVEKLAQTIDQPDALVIARLRKNISVLQLDPTQSEHYNALREHLQATEDAAGVCLHRLFYLSIPPQIYSTVVAQLGKNGLNAGCKHGNTASRLLVEKPFGFDLASAEALISDTAEYFDKEQVFRIDHYLAKETAQNILTFRQSNPLFSQIWNNQHITRVSITAAEQIGIEGRANFYDNVGALRDLIQSHLMQLLSLTLMDIPAELTADAVHEAKQAVLESLQPIPANNIAQHAVRGQYATYGSEIGNPESATETYASLVLASNDSRWQNVPLRLTTGKALKIKRTSITLDFGSADNRLQFRVQPDEGITLTMQVKKPGLDGEVEPTSMNFTYQTAFAGEKEHDAYERVLIEAVRGDHLLFATDEEVLASWRVLQPLLDSWGANANDLVIYPNGSDGPDTTQLLTTNHDN